MRTWTIHGGQVTAGIEPGDKSCPPVKVVELAPVLDLIEACEPFVAGGEIALEERIDALLIANRRLPTGGYPTQRERKR